MSNTTNDQLMERAREMCEQWTGTTWEKVILQDIQNNDLEALHNHVNLAEAEASREHFYKYNIIGDNDVW